MADVASDDLLVAYTPARPFTMDAVSDAPRAPGVHLVLAAGVVVYVGRTGNLRDRLRQHLIVNRGSSVLHDQVGRKLDRSGPEATAADIASWLGQCEVRWRETDDPEAEKDTLVLAFGPRFNRQVPKRGRQRPA
jgi:hypothetical protein